MIIVVGTNGYGVVVDNVCGAAFVRRSTTAGVTRHGDYKFAERGRMSAILAAVELAVQLHETEEQIRDAEVQP